MDILNLIQGARFVLYSTTWRLYFVILFFYAVRFIVQALVILEFPEGYNWGWPGFYSIFVPYGETSDFFYSGHVGNCMIHLLEF